MARSFVTASSQYLESSTVAQATPPISFSCWVKPADLTTSGYAFTLGDTSNAEYMNIGITATGNKAFFETTNGIAYNSITTTTSYTAGSWHHIFGSIGSGSPNKSVYLNGAGLAQATINLLNWDTLDTTSVGCLRRGASRLLYFNGDIAECAIWNANIDVQSGVVQALAAGYSPLNIYPQNLVAYYPLLGRTSPEIDLSSANGLTLGNAPAVAAHPRIIYPHKQPVVRAGSGAAPASTARSFSVVIA